MLNRFNLFKPLFKCNFLFITDFAVATWLLYNIITLQKHGNLLRVVIQILLVDILNLSQINEWNIGIN